MYTELFYYYNGPGCHATYIINSSIMCMQVTSYTIRIEEVIGRVYEIYSRSNGCQYFYITRYVNNMCKYDAKIPFNIIVTFALVYHANVTTNFFSLVTLQVAYATLYKYYIRLHV